MSGPPTLAGLFNAVPNEMLVNIMAHMPDLATLLNFTKAFPPSRNLYRASPRQILAGTIAQDGSLTMQLKKLVCTIINIRNNPVLSGITDLDEYLDRHLERQSLPPQIDCIPKPSLALQEIVTITQDIQAFESSLIAACLREPGTQPCFTHHETPSPTEIYRIKRAFWRLQLLCDLFKYRASGTVPVHLAEEPEHNFFKTLAKWELEELECAYYHVHDLYSKLRVAAMPRNFQTPMIRRLLTNLSYEISVPDKIDCGYTSEATNLQEHRRETITGAFEWRRDMQWQLNVSKTGWSEIPSAHSPNDGWKLCARQEGWNGEPEVPSLTEIGREPMAEFLGWGYCMWDDIRFRNWGLVDSSWQMRDYEKWDDVEMTRLRCTRCLPRVARRHCARCLPLFE